MARVRFNPGTRYLYKGSVYLVRQALTGKKLLVENTSFGGEERLSIEDLYAAWGRGEIYFEVSPKLARKAPGAPLATEYTIADFQGLKDPYQKVAWGRYQGILPVLKLPPQERTRAVFESRAKALQAAATIRASSKRARIGFATSRASLQRWLKDFEESGWDVRSLVPASSMRKDKGLTRLDLDVERHIQAVLKNCIENPTHRTLDDVYKKVINDIAEANRSRAAGEKIDPPTKMTIYRRIQAAGPVAILQRRASRLEAHAQEPVNPGPDPTRILERVEIDFTTLDLFIVDEDDRFPIGRPTLTYALDVYSGFPVGLYVGFEAHSYRAAQNCLLHAILPKVDTRQVYGTEHLWIAYGLAETLIVDNDKPFIGNDLKDACGQLGILLEQMPVRTPWFKAKIERFFRTNNTGVIHGLPGTSFSNLIQRGDYDSLKHACISLSEFWKLLHVFLLDDYAQDEHTDLKIVPAHRWEESLQSGFLPALHNSADEVRMLLYRTGWRCIKPVGIDFEALRYQGPELYGLRKQLHTGEKVRFKYNTGDMSTIYVFPPRQRPTPNPSQDEMQQAASVPSYNEPPPYQPPIPIKAIDPEGYTQGLSLWKHRVVRRYLLKQNQPVDIYKLAEAKQHIQQIVEEAYKRTRAIRGRTKAARFLEKGTGPLPIPQTVPSVPAVPAPTDTQKEEHPEPVQASDAVLSMPEGESPDANTTGSLSKAADQPIETSSPAGAGDQPKPSRRNRKKHQETSTLPPVTPEPLDLSGWGADYDLSHPASE